jgi:hypothetical protein
MLSTDLGARSRDLDAGELRERAIRFRTYMQQIRRRAGDAGGYGFYPYDSFGVFEFLPEILAGEQCGLLELVGDLPVLDVGTADGDLAFFFESLGFEVHALDHPSTNFNCMLGAAELKAALCSAVRFQKVDLDAPFELPAPRYGLCLCLGLLYHLKNPFQLLETLARKAAYCLLSTRIAQASPDRGTDFRHLPLAYLVDPQELNADITNFWIFTEPGLRRILSRSGWEVRGLVTTGCCEPSDPITAAGDQRAYCMARSRVLDPAWRVRLGAGWHDLEDQSWRWTGRRFSFSVYLDQPACVRRLELDFIVPPAQLDRLGPITAACRVNGVQLASYLVSTPGRHTYAQAVRASVASMFEIQFELDKAYGPAEADLRELGVLVPFTRCGRPVSDSNLPLRLATEVV